MALVMWLIACAGPHVGVFLIAFLTDYTRRAHVFETIIAVGHLADAILSTVFAGIGIGFLAFIIYCMRGD